MSNTETENQTEEQTKRKVSSAKGWKQKARQGIELKVPSGNVCLARRPGMQAFIREGVVPNSLMPMIKKALNEGKNINVEETAKKVLGEDALDSVIQFVDSVAIYCVIEPKMQSVPMRKVSPQPIKQMGDNSLPVMEIVSIDERDEDVLYVDEVDEDDKMFIFQWAVGGSADVTKFHGEQSQLVESLQTGENVGS